MELEATGTQKTINYFQFKHIASNRPVDQKHVAKLAAEIQKKNRLHMFPIKVNLKMEIIDGQHRLAAAEQLGVYIYYEIESDLTEDDIADVNKLSKNWGINDYINFWSVREKSGFDVLSRFLLDNPFIPPSTALMMLSKEKKRDLNGLRSGTIDVGNHEQALVIAAILKEFSELTNMAYERNFVLAVIHCVQTPGYDHAKMQKKVEGQPRSLVKCISVKQYIEMLSEIYNYNDSRNRLKF